MTVTEAIEKTKTQVLEALSCNIMKFSELMNKCGLQLGQFVEHLPHSRVLDRALQSLRKDGKIRFNKRQGRWQAVPSGDE